MPVDVFFRCTFHWCYQGCCDKAKSWSDILAKMKKCKLCNEKEIRHIPAFPFRFWCSPQNFRALGRVGRIWQGQPDQAFEERDCNPPLMTSPSPNADEYKSCVTCSSLRAGKCWKWLCKASLQRNSCYLRVPKLVWMYLKKNKAEGEVEA